MRTLFVYPEFQRLLELRKDSRAGESQSPSASPGVGHRGGTSPSGMGDEAGGPERAGGDGRGVELGLAGDHFRNDRPEGRHGCANQQGQAERSSCGRWWPLCKLHTLSLIHI